MRFKLVIVAFVLALGFGTGGCENRDPAANNNNNNSSNPTNPTRLDASTYCSGGGKVSGQNIKGTVCIGPVDHSGSKIQAFGLKWLPGPIYRLDR